MRKIDLIVIHCSATRENKPFPVTSLIAYPEAVILGHRDLPGVHKKCPCFDAAEEYRELKA